MHDKFQEMTVHSVMKKAGFHRVDPLNRSRLGVLLVLFSAIGFAAKGILAKMLYQKGLNSSTVLSLRMISVLPIYLAGIFFFGRSTPAMRPTHRDPDFWKIILLGLLGFDLSAILDFEGLVVIGASLERLVLFLYPTFVVLISALLQKRRIVLREILSVIMAYIGLYIMTDRGHGTGREEWGGILLVLASGIFYAFYLIGVERVISRVNPLYLTSVVMVTATGAIVLQSVLLGSFHPSLADLHSFFLIGIMGIFSTALPTFFMSLGISMIGASRAALISFTGPLVTLMLAWIFLGETMDLKEGMGGLLIVVGVGMISFNKEKWIRKNG